MASNKHDGTALSFLDAMVNLGDNPDMESINSILNSFGHLNHKEQDEVMQSPKYWNCLAKWGTEEDREEMSRRNVERLKEDLEDVIYGVGTRKSAAVKDEAARLLATIPKDGKLFEWTRAMVCKENPGTDPATGKAVLGQWRIKRIQGTILQLAKQD
ncbi:MAG: hypothetical protein Q9161_002228 [Pseudevernia consocians]